MHCNNILLAISLALVANAQDSGSRRGRIGTSQFESVSTEPLTFEVAEPDPVSRERILAEADINGAEFDFVEKAEEIELVNLEGEYFGEDEEEVIFGDFEDADEYDDMEEDVEYDTPYEELGQADAEVDSTYVSEDGVNFAAQEDELIDESESGGDGDEGDEDGEGSEDVGEPMVFSEPISRKLRRVVKKNDAEEIDEERYLAEKESLRDDSIPIFEPTLDENGEFEVEADPSYLEDISPDDHDGRDLQSGCRWNQVRVKIQIITDFSGWETSWSVKNINGALVARGPPGNSKYADSRTYLGGLCLNAGSYRFTVNDAFKDGMCGGNTGKGLYRFYINDSKRFTSPSNCYSRWGQRVHSFTIRSPSAPAQAPTGAISGRGGCSNVKVQFKTDKYGKETVVTLTGNGATQMASRKDVGAYQTKTMQKCVPPGTYTLRLVDNDGICCQNGKGWYRMYVNGVSVISGGYFIGSKTHTIKVGTNWQSRMSARAREWLNAHNSRRRKYNGGAGYVALRWSTTLASDAKNYAESLGNNCKNGKLVHAKGIQDGENLAKNQGGGTWGGQYASDKIMNRWVENELNWSYPSNAHYTQVVWRATQYVGCGESVRNVGGNQMCRIQVCRYTRAGNCNVRNGNWRAEAWKDDSSCGKMCPREGCYA